MVRFQRSIQIARGKLLKARQWAKEVTEYANSNHPGSTLLVFSERFGDITKFAWQADFDDLAALDQYQESFNTDEGYWAMVNKSTELFVEGSLFDAVYETL